MTADLPALDAAALRQRLTDGSRWRQIDVVPETGSTNADLVARVQSGEDVDGVVLITENQTAGRGRQGRTWSAVPRSQILMSAGVGAAEVPTTAWGLLSLATGVAVVEAVAEVTGIRAALKWPNDVLVGGGKLAGILADVAVPATSKAVPVIVVGVGLNVSIPAADLPDPAAVSVLSLGVAQPDRQQLAAVLLDRLDRRIGDWRANGRDPLLADYRALSCTLGQTVRAELPGGREVVGQATDIDGSGALVIESAAGVVQVSAGDVVHLRPADA